MKETIKVINTLKAEGVLKDYALGGAMALLFYTEPELTFDVDVFVFLPNQNGQKMVSMAPLFEALAKKGYPSRQGHAIMIENVAVDFLSGGPLIQEAIEKAEIKDYEGSSVRVFSLEHLLAIMVDTGRHKDKERIGDILESRVEFDRAKLKEILSRYQLTRKWEKISGQIIKRN